MSKSATTVKKNVLSANVTYKDSLDIITKERYEDKLKIIGGVDPYVVGKDE